MLRQDVSIIDGDGHIFEDIPAIAQRLASPFREMAAARYNRLPLFPPNDHLHTPLRENPATRSGRGDVGPDEWLTFLEDVEIETTVLYPSSGLSYGYMTNRDIAIALTRAYNDWLHDTYLLRSPRFRGMGLLPMQDPEAAAEELRRIVENLGMCGAMLPGNGLQLNLGAKMYWPVYQEANRLGCCLAVHGGVHNGLGMDDFDTFAPVHALGHPFALLISFADMLFNGVFDRFPNVRFAFLEAGVAWLLMAMERFDGSYASFTQADLRGEHLRLAPGTKVSRYIMDLIDGGRLFVGCEGDELMLRQSVELVGAKPFIYSSDFPHEVTNETCKEEIEELVEYEGLTDSDKQAILRENAERLYGLQAPVGV
jgi:uncharacterized protein